MAIRTILLCFILVSSSVVFAKPPTSDGSSSRGKSNSTTGSPGVHIIANPDDYFLNGDLELFANEDASETVTIPSGTQWYQAPDVEKLRDELNAGMYSGAEKEEKEKILFGYDIMTKTYEVLGPNRTDGRPALYTGQIMNCSACHAQGGTVPHSWPLTRTYSHFRLRANLDAPPQDGEGEFYGPLGYWRDTITVNRDCGINCAGQGEIPKDSYEMDALVAWTKAVQEGIYPGEGILIPELKLKSNNTKIPGARIPIFEKVLNDPEFKADPKAGKVAYDRTCASCHGKDGLGKWSEKSGYTVPPVAGGGSHTKAGGPYMVPVLAAFIQRQMPLSQPGSLTEQEAIDIAAYLSDMPRDSRWWEDYYYDHNPCKRSAFLSLDVGVTPVGFPFSDADTRYGPWQPIKEWLANECPNIEGNEPSEPILPEDFDAGFDGADFINPGIYALPRN
ncbi:c-type cytochrome [Methylomarinum sp. Ch1-1]|uniref:C-type cytochrome n=1 Tax=Methylomarinum roseum TaxID=3067653 RepID=A0AAU7NS87_9GAMM|nr:c-type cytochrome [Methylomarinum sp. Ch1-1]MDP4520159.1 c-type cytochrome [Methylomarinum sp. Ch1-1]